MHAVLVASMGASKQNMSGIGHAGGFATPCSPSIERTSEWGAPVASGMKGKVNPAITRALGIFEHVFLRVWTALTWQTRTAT